VSIDSIENIIFWIALPTVRLTENSEYKWVRIIGILCMFPLFPLCILGLGLLFLAIFADMFIEA